MTEFFVEVLRHHSFLYKAQNKYTNKQLRINKHLFIFNFDMSQIFLVIQALNPFETFCGWTLMIATKVSVAICPLPILKKIYCDRAWILISHVNDIRVL